VSKEDKAKIDTNWDEIDKMLSVIPPDTDRQTWLNIAMAVHQFDYISDDKLGYDKFLEWSKGGGKSFKGEWDIRTTWNSIKPSSKGVGVGTLFTIAYEYGYVKDKKHLFAPVDNSVDNSVDNLTNNDTLGEPTHPDEIIRSLMPAEPEMDLDVLPPIIKDYSTELSETIGSDPAVSVFAMLSVVCGVADARMRLELMRGYEVPPVMWFMTVGSPSSKKTPASTPAFGILGELERSTKREYETDMVNWEAKEAIYNRQKKEYIENADSALDNDVTFPMPDELPQKPAPLRYTVSDITSQKLVRHCSIRPQGTLCYLDEMTGWINKITSDKNGEDNATWLEGYSASDYHLDRVVDGEIHCPNFAVSIYGNIQPRVLRGKIKILARDGILQRFIPVVLRKRFNKVGRDILASDDKLGLWEQYIRTIHTNKQLKYTLTGGAYDSFRAFQYWVEDYKKDLEKVDNDDIVLTAVGKIEGTVGRLALLFHLVENPYTTEVNEDTMNRVVKWTKEFIIPSFKHTYGEAGADNATEVDLWTMKHIIQQAGTEQTIKLRDLKRAGKRLMRRLEVERDDYKTNLLKDAMMSLEEHNWVTMVQENGKSTIWQINSKLSTEFKEYKNKVIDEIEGVRVSRKKIS
jgi:hypothetical protein